MLFWLTLYVADIYYLVQVADAQSLLAPIASIKWQISPKELIISNSNKSTFSLDKTL